MEEPAAAEADNLPEAPPQEGDPRLPGRATALMRQFSVAAATVLPRPAPPVPLVKMALCG